MPYEFKGEMYEYNTYGDRAVNKYPTTIIAENADEAKEKAKVAFSAKYDQFRKFWSHALRIDSVTEIADGREGTE